MNNQAIILDTETHAMHGLPVQIAHLPCSFEQGGFALNENAIFDQLFSIDEPITYGAMAVHHIIDADLIGKPSYKTFLMPDDAIYIIGHNIQYDLAVLRHCGINTDKYKPICTLALARYVYPEAPEHNISALSYMLSSDQATTRELIKNAHSAKADILLTGGILKNLIHSLGITSMDALYQASEKALVPTHISFGKHRGTAVGKLPPDYVRWLLSKDELDTNLRTALMNIARASL